MAVIQFTSEVQCHAYAALARFNGSFKDIVDNLDDMDKHDIFDDKALAIFRGYAKELQAQVNCKLLETLQDIEEQHAFEQGKVRIQREHYLNDQRPAFHEQMPKATPAPKRKAKAKR